MGPIRKYLLIMIPATVLPLVVVFAVNILYDPLWYFKGNRIEPINYAFNERIAKTNQFLKKYPHKKYNAIIFGSSRSTLLNETLLDSRMNAYNFAFSAGRVQEFTAFARWLKWKGVTPEYIIVGIDDYNFVEQARELNIPDFITTLQPPPSIFKSYLSLDALEMSFKLFIHRSPVVRFYTSDFLCTVGDDAPEYRPLQNKEPAKKIPNPDAVKAYVELKEVFPEAVYIGYVPPVSIWETLAKSKTELDHLLASYYELSRLFDYFYDFTIPGEVVSRPENTYDGTHFYPRVNALIARVLNGEKLNFGYPLKEHTRSQYIQDYKHSLRDVLHTLGQPISAVPDNNRFRRIRRTSTRLKQSVQLERSGYQVQPDV